MKKVIFAMITLLSLFVIMSCDSDSPSAPAPLTDDERAVLADIGNSIYSAIMQGDANWNPSTGMSFGQEYTTVADVTLTNCTLVTGSTFTVTLNSLNFEFDCEMIIGGNPNTTITMSASGPLSGLQSGEGMETSGSYGSKDLSKGDIMTVISGLLSGGQD